MNDEEITTTALRSRVESELQIAVDAMEVASTPELKSMLAYHMGWEGDGAGTKAQGKRIRPLIVLLSAGAAGGDWEKALPAAVAVELIHNFSLIHDDIQDNSTVRHGRLTVWKKWGIPQAINAGDLMFVLAHRALLGMKEGTSVEITMLSSQILQNTCVELTRGQYLDMSYESRQEVTLEDYWAMVKGKTGALIACAAELGALASGSTQTKRSLFHQYGLSLGMAFQAWDDWLGIWGDSALTGKSNESDLVSGKKSLPVVFGLSKGGRFARRWLAGPIGMDEVKHLADLLTDDGAQSYTQQFAENYLNESLAALADGSLDNEYSHQLRELTLKLLGRKN